jgi:hypothetical protein
MTLFVFASVYVAIVLLLLAAGPLWAWVALWRKEWRKRRQRVEEFREQIHHFDRGHG